MKIGGQDKTLKCINLFILINPVTIFEKLCQLRTTTDDYVQNVK